MIYRHDKGSWWAESPELPAWTAAAETLAELQAIIVESVPITIKELAEDEGILFPPETVIEHLILKALRPRSVPEPSSPILPLGLPLWASPLRRPAPSREGIPRI